MKLPARKIATCLLVLLILIGVLVGYKIVRWKAYVWLPDYAQNLVRSGRKTTISPKHVMFVFADHYETGPGDKGRDRNRIWLKRYVALADKHKDSYGRSPQHTWFYAYEQKNAEVMTDLDEAVRLGYGEIELHWHHKYDTNETFPGKLKEALEWFNSFGALVSRAPGGAVRFAFVHGNWGLDDSRGAAYCGVTRELDILREAGCYADFTFPSFGCEAQPAEANSIYYAKDDDRPKSYNCGQEAAVNGNHDGAFMIFEGPLGLAFNRQLFEYGAVEDNDVPSPSRVDRWIGTSISVSGRPEWIFVKIYTHGIGSDAVTTGQQADRMFTYLEKRYGRGDYRLHYVTAREAFNIVRAAERGFTGDPDQYRNLEIKEPVNKFVKPGAPM